MTEDNKHVLILMEDDDVLRRYLAKLLRMDNYEVLEAASVKEAVEKANTPALDLVIADLKMPDDTAIGLMKKLAQMHIKLPVIIVTAYGEWETYLEALDLGVCDYLNKPVDYKELKEKIKAVLLTTDKKRRNKSK